MKFFALIFFSSLLFGTIAGVSLIPGVTIYVHDAALFLLFLVSCIVCIWKKRWTKPKLFLPIVTFTAIGGASLLLNAFRVTPVELTQSSLYLLRWIFYAGIYVVCVQSFIPVSFWVWGLAITGWGFAGLGLVQYQLYPSLRNLSYLGWDPHYFRLFSTLLDPNFVGILFVFSFFITIYLWKTTKKNWIIFFLILLGVSLYLTYSRSSYVAFLVGSGFLLARCLRRKFEGIIALIIFIVLIIFLPKPGGDTLRIDRMVSTIARVANWQESVKRIGESPLVGFGFNTLRFVFPSDNGRVDANSKAAAGVDNSVLFIFLTTGIIGCIAYCWLLYGQWRQAQGLLRKKHALLGNIVLASLLAVLVHSMFVNSLFYPWVMIWMWIMTGVAERHSGKSDHIGRIQNLILDGTRMTEKQG